MFFLCFFYVFSVFIYLTRTMFFLRSVTKKKTMNIHSFDLKKFCVFSMFFLCFFIVLHKHRMYATRHPTFVNIDISLFFLCFFYVLIFDQNYVFSTNRDFYLKNLYMLKLANSISGVLRKF